MCKAWDGAMQMYADEARAATRKEMKKEMKKEMRRQAREKDRRTVFNMFSRGVFTERNCGNFRAAA